MGMMEEASKLTLMLPVSASESKSLISAMALDLPSHSSESTPHVIGGHMEAESSIRGARADLGDDSGHEERLEVTGSSPR